MSESVASQSTDQFPESGRRVARTDGRTYGDELVTERDQVRVSSARSSAKTSSLISPLERIQARLVPEGDCRVYSGARDEKGYGRVSVGGKNRKAHRVLYEQIHGPIPDGLVVMHSCDNPPCCELGHLSLGSLVDNNRDAQAKGRSRGVPFENRLKELCKRGHPLSGDNLKIRNGWRLCRACKRATR